MISEEIAPLLLTDRLPPNAFHTGRVLTFDPVSGSNAVEVAGKALVDLPMLNIGDTVSLEQDDVVLLLRVKNTMFIVGRVVLPGAGVKTAAVSFQTGTVSAQNYQITTSESTAVSVSSTPPAWANAVSVIATVHALGRNQRGVVDYMYTRVAINGVNGAQQLAPAAAPNPSYAFCSASFSGSGAVVGGVPFTIAAAVKTNGGTWTADALNQCDLTYSVVYTRV